MSTQQPSKTAVILKDTVAIGEVKGFEWGVNVSDIEEHDMIGGNPVVCEPLENSYWFRFSKGWVDNAYVTIVTGGTKFSFEVREAGTGSNKPKTVLAGAFLTRYSEKAAKGAIILTDCEGKAASATPGTQPA